MIIKQTEYKHEINEFGVPVAIPIGEVEVEVPDYFIEPEMSLEDRIKELEDKLNELKNQL